VAADAERGASAGETAVASVAADAGTSTVWLTSSRVLSAAPNARLEADAFVRRVPLKRDVIAPKEAWRTFRVRVPVGLVEIQPHQLLVADA
jgi:hypothetical protein